MKAFTGEQPKQGEEDITPSNIEIGDPGGGGADLGYYPNSRLKVQVGDILHVSKSSSTWFVGHVGIVGTDGRVRHIVPGGKLNQTISQYRTRFGEITVLRHKSSSTAYFAGKKSRELYSSMETYRMSLHLGTLKYNYCSKFVWQSFYYGLGRDAFGWSLTDSKSTLILPADFKRNPNVTSYGPY